MQRFACISMICLVLGASCSTQRSETPELKLVKTAVSEAVPGTIVGVTLSPAAHLTINLINSPLKKLPDAERESKAKDIARIGFRSYPGNDKLKAVRVAYVILDTAVIVIATNDSSDAFTFYPGDLQE